MSLVIIKREMLSERWKLVQTKEKDRENISKWSMMNNYPSFSSSSPPKIALTELLNSEKTKPTGSDSWHQHFLMTCPSPSRRERNRSRGKRRSVRAPTQSVPLVDGWLMENWFMCAGVTQSKAIVVVHERLTSRRLSSSSWGGEFGSSSFRIGSSQKKEMLLSRCVCFYLLPSVNGCW